MLRQRKGNMLYLDKLENEIHNFISEQTTESYNEFFKQIDGMEKLTRITPSQNSIGEKRKWKKKII